MGLVKTMVEIANFFIIVNETPWGSFNVCRGLRQGDKISPYIFIMIEKGLGRSFSRLAYVGSLVGVKATTSIPPY